MNALIGKTGFVGSNLLGQHDFTGAFNRENIEEAHGKIFDLVVCAAAPGSMVEANKFPDRDKQRMDMLIESLSKIRARHFVLISSIAVLSDFAGKDDEGTSAFQKELAYGRNRRFLECFCADRYKRCSIIRLPALYGADLRKNFIFDLMHPIPTMLTAGKYQDCESILPGDLIADFRSIYTWSAEIEMHRIDRSVLTHLTSKNALETLLLKNGLSSLQFTNPDSTFQYYGLDGLWADIERCIENDISVLHMATEPQRAGDVCEALTGTVMAPNSAKLHHEDMRTRHSAVWGQLGPYCEDKRTTVSRLKTFFEKETIR